MIHGSLFSGIGGIDLGFQAAGIPTIWQVEIEPHCQAILEKNFPNAKRYADVRECGNANLQPVDILSGGFPCQDISVAGAQRGLDGKRSGLWFEMYRIIRELEPRWVFIENVAALRNKGGDTVLANLEEAGYACWPSVVGAWAIGSPQNRKRSWIVGYAEHNGLPSLEVLREFAKAIQHDPEGTHETRQFTRTGTSSLLAGHFPAAIGEPQYLWEYPRIVEPGMGESIDGVSRELALVALGNAVVPQLPYVFGRVIQTLDRILHES